MFYESVLRIALLVIPLSIIVYYLWILFEEKILNKFLSYKRPQVRYVESEVSLEQESLFGLYEKTTEKLIDLEVKLFSQLYKNEKTNEEIFRALSQKLDSLDSKVGLLANKIENIVQEPLPKTVDPRFKTPFVVR